MNGGLFMTWQDKLTINEHTYQYMNLNTIADDYQINLKAELEIRHLHDKLDHLLSHQWQRLAEMQEIQLDLLSEMSKKH